MSPKTTIKYIENIKKEMQKRKSTVEQWLRPIQPDLAMDCTHPCVIFLIAVALVFSGSVVPSDASFRKIPEGRREMKRKFSGNARAASPPPYNKPPERRMRQRAEVKTNFKQVSFIPLAELCTYFRILRACEVRYKVVSPDWFLLKSTIYLPVYIKYSTLLRERTEEWDCLTVNMAFLVKHAFPF